VYGSYACRIFCDQCVKICVQGTNRVQERAFLKVEQTRAECGIATTRPIDPSPGVSLPGSVRSISTASSPEARRACPRGAPTAPPPRQPRGPAPARIYEGALLFVTDISFNYRGSPYKGDWRGRMTEGPRLSRPAAPRGGPSAPRRGGGRPRVERQAKINRVDPYFGSTLTVSNRDSQSNCWVNLKLMGQPCEFQSIALARGVGVARIARAGSPRLRSLAAGAMAALCLRFGACATNRLGVGDADPDVLHDCEPNRFPCECRGRIYFRRPPALNGRGELARRPHLRSSCPRPSSPLEMARRGRPARSARASL
jgi:hypothetical protein